MNDYAAYHLHLERLNEVLPGKDFLSRKDIVDFTGISLNSVRRHFPFTGTYVSKVDFARMLAKEMGK